MIVWVCGKNIDPDLGNCWEFAGVFSTEEKAINACHSDEYFIGPTGIDKDWPDETCEWPGAYYPRNE